MDAQVVTIGAKGFGTNHLDLSAEQQGLAVPDAKGRELLNLLMEAGLEVGEGRRRLDPDGAREGVAVQASCGIALQAGLEFLVAGFQNGKAGGHRVPTEPMQ